MAQSAPIHTERLQIVPFSSQYLTERYVGWLNDQDTVKYSEQRHRIHTLESCRSYMQSFEAGPHYFWAIVTLSEAPLHIGNINAYLDTHNGVADVGILVGERSVWGKGYATEAWLAVCRYLLIDQRVRKVTAGTSANNLAMLGIMRRTKMRPDGVRAKHFQFGAEAVDMVHAALFRDDV